MDSWWYTAVAGDEWVVLSDSQQRMEMGAEYVVKSTKSVATD